jgi:amino acid adenylation domain-containing protein
MESRISKYNIEAVYPLTAMQRGMLFHSLYERGAGVYVVQFTCPVYGGLDAEAFKMAWQKVIDRHPALRTLIAWEGRDTPLQIVRSRVDLPWEEQDWRNLSDGQQRGLLQSYLNFDRERGFELSEAPLTRMALIRLAEEKRQFIWTTHHILMDGWSSQIIIKEALGFYEAFCSGRELYLEPPRPYRDYIAWLQGQDLSAAEDFWRRSLAGVSSPTPLPLGVGSSTARYATDQVRHTYLSAPSMEALQSFARERGLTLNTLVTGAWALLLSHYSGARDVVFGATVSGRTSELAGIESMTGLYINTLPVRARVSPEVRLASWLQDLQAVQVETRQYEYSSLVDIQRWSDAPRGIPLFQTILVFENYPMKVTSNDSTANHYNLKFGAPQVSDSTNYPLMAMAIPGASLELRIVYDSRWYNAAAAGRILSHFQSLLEGMVAGADKPVGDLSPLTTTHRHHLFEEWNDTETALPEEPCVHRLIELHAERTPDAVAVVCGEGRLTYGELNRRANKVAWNLQARGVGPEVLVAILAERSFDLILGILGVLKAGGAYIPLDPTYPRRRLGLILENARPNILLAQKPLIDRLPERDCEISYLDADWDLIARQSDTNPVSGVSSRNLAYVIYTSGSTGRPKGIAIERHNVVNFLHWVRGVFSEEELDATLASSSISFDLSVFELFAPLISGGKAILIQNILHLIDLPGNEEVTLLNSVPSALAELLKAGLAPGSVRTITLAGERLKGSLVRQINQQKGIDRLFNLYGPAETTTYSTIVPVSKDIDDEPPIGRPINNTKVYLLNSWLAPVPIGSVGEMYIGGDGLARGYLGRPDLTAEKFVPNPLSATPGARVYHTGDLASYLPDGNLEFHGRSDYQVKIRGFRIELDEVAAAIEQHPAVSRAVVTVRELTGGDKRLVAYVEPEQNQTGLITELRGFLKERLPAYLVPSDFVEIDKLPLNPNNKVDRQALPTAMVVVKETEDGYVAPQTETERTIAAVWQEALNVEKVGIYDNFFDIGGHSLLLVQIYSKLREQLKPDLLMTDVFKYPTVHSLAQYLVRPDFRPSGLPSADDKLEKLEESKDRLKEGFKQRLRARGAHDEDAKWVIR